MMHWNSFAEFLSMGGKGFYVWGAFGATALCLILEPLLLARRARVLRARLIRQMRAEQNLSAPPESPQ
ncbi:MAG: heme exporter protein CcmD [Zoogloeaceae bacterium]|jgi:heme exporter protein D|nr:heme exporter protein CcmD [Zoogloeaceae bacterium]